MPSKFAYFLAESDHIGANDNMQFSNGNYQIRHSKLANENANG